MDQLRPLFRITPPLLVAYGIVAAFADLAELRATMSSIAMAADSSAGTRAIHFAAIVRGFYSMFFFIGLAAIVAALNARLPEETR